MANANGLLSEVLKGLRQMCNHCCLHDCQECWSNDMCNKITKYFETIPPYHSKILKLQKTPSPTFLKHTPKI